MHDFTFHNPTRIIFGKDTEEQIGAELKLAGIKKILLVFGRNSSKKNGLYDRVTNSLKDCEIKYIDHGGVASNPTLDHTRAGVQLAKAQGVDAILAVGGGSVIDESKAIAVGALSDDDIWDYFTDKEVVAALPLYTVLTIAATGSEMNGNSVITNVATEQKYNISSPHVYPRLSILNPALTCTVPPDYSAYSAVDAIAHVIEAYFTKGQGGPRLQDRFVENIIRTVIDTNNIIKKEPANYAARAEFMWAATLALNGLTNLGVGPFSFPNHMLEHALSGIYNIAHGAGLAIIMPAWMRWQRPNNPDQFARFAKEIFGLDNSEDGIVALEEWFTKLGAPIRLGQADIPSADLEKIAANAFALASKWGIGDSYPPEVIIDILKFAI